MALLSSNRIKFIRSLSRKKFRDETGLFIAEGEKLVSEALKSSFSIREIYRTDEIGKEAMGRISALSSPSPVLAVIEQPAQSAPDEICTLLSRAAASTSGENTALRKAPLFLALDGIRDPGNMGTIIRLADWFGIDAVFASEDSVEIYNPKVVQATMGAIFRKQVIYASLPEVIKEFQKLSLPVYGTFLDGENLYNVPLKKEGLIVMGSESCGILPETAALITERLFIPPYPEGVPSSESLNVAAAAAILCAEFRR